MADERQGRKLPFIHQKRQKPPGFLVIVSTDFVIFDYQTICFVLIAGKNRTGSLIISVYIKRKDLP